MTNIVGISIFRSFRGWWLQSALVAKGLIFMAPGCQKFSCMQKCRGNKTGGETVYIAGARWLKRVPVSQFLLYILYLSWHQYWSIGFNIFFLIIYIQGIPENKGNLSWACRSSENNTINFYKISFTMHLWQNIRL